MKNIILKLVLGLLYLNVCQNLYSQTQFEENEINRITRNISSNIFVNEEIKMFEDFFRTLPNSTKSEILTKARYAADLSLAYDYQNRIWESEEVLKSSLNDLETINAFLEEQYFEVVTVLYAHYMSISSFKNAFYYATRTQSTYESLLVYDEKYVYSLLFASGALRAMREYSFAMRYAKSGVFQAQELYQNNPTKENEVLLIYALSTVSNTCGERNIYDSIKYIKEAIDLCKRSGRTDDKVYNSVVTDLARLYLIIGKYDKAYEILKSVEFDGTEYSLFLFLERCLAEYCLNTKDLISTTEKLTTINKKYVSNKLSSMTSSEKISYWERINESYRIVNMLYHKKRTHSDVIYDNLLFSKGYLLKDQRDLKKKIYSSDNIEVIKLYDKVVELRKTMNYETNSDKRRALLEELEETEKSVIRMLPDSIYSFQVSWKDVRDHLKADEVAIEFFTIPNLEIKNGIKTTGDIYCAAILKKNYKTPHIVELCNDSMLHKVDSELYYQSNDLYNLFWKPISTEIKDCKNVYFSPDYEMNNIAIEYVKDDKGDNISSLADYYRLSSTRELLVKKNKRNIKNAVLYGGLKYEMSQEEMASIGANYTHSDLASNRNFEVDTINVRTGVTYLKGTKQEVDEIYKEFSSHKDIKVSLFTGEFGVEESFKSLDGKAVNVLHIATHGYYFSDSLAQLQLKKGNDYLNVQQRGDGSMLARSGLFLSGANRVLKGKSIPKNSEDGVLTALEVSEMNLDSLDLIIMSACSSGLGDISFDGVYGLQRGFKMSGAKTIIMSLWPVDDIATKMLMISFYKHYLLGKTKLQSLKLAQEFVKSQKVYDSPKYWAGFIMLDGVD